MATFAELLEKSQSAPLSRAEAEELAAHIRAQDEAQAQAKRALRAAGMRFPSAEDAAKIATLAESAMFLLRLERMYNVAKVAAATNDYNNYAEKYGWPFCDDPAKLLEVMEKNIPSSQWTQAEDTHKNVRRPKYTSWQKAIRLLATLDAARKSGKVHRIVKDDD